MILIDSRAGSQDLVVPLAAAGLPVDEAVLPFGDLAFVGRGEGGKDTFIGVEHKRLSDLVQSLTSDRFAGHQLPGMLATFDRNYLVIEGDFDVDASGRVIVPGKWRGRSQPLKGCPPAAVLEQRVMTLETRGGVRVRWTRTQKETIRYVSSLYRFWVDRDLDAHKSHLAIHAPDLDRSLLTPVSDFRRVVSQLPGVGYAVSADLERAFNGSLRRMMLASEAEWAAVELTSDKGKTRKFGPKRAKSILEALR